MASICTVFQPDHGHGPSLLGVGVIVCLHLGLSNLISLKQALSVYDQLLGKFVAKKKKKISVSFLRKCAVITMLTMAAFRNAKLNKTDFDSVNFTFLSES